MKERYFYWLPEDNACSLQKSELFRRLRIMPVLGVPCKGFHPVAENSIVAPEIWDKVCYRQGSWYRASDKNGLYLLITTEKLSDLDEYYSGTIYPVDFKPPHFATEEDVAILLERIREQGGEPPDWRQVRHHEHKYWQNLLSRIGVRDTLSHLIDLQTANHANFMYPLLYVEENGEKVPYSIGTTREVCSVCVEMFNIVGEQFRKKYVMPCPGSVQYAKLKKDEWLAVVIT